MFHNRLLRSLYARTHRLPWTTQRGGLIVRTTEGGIVATLGNLSFTVPPLRTDRPVPWFPIDRADLEWQAGQDPSTNDPAAYHELGGPFAPAVVGALAPRAEVDGRRIRWTRSELHVLYRDRGRAAVVLEIRDQPVVSTEVDLDGANGLLATLNGASVLHDAGDLQGANALYEHALMPSSWKAAADKLVEGAWASLGIVSDNPLEPPARLAWVVACRLALARGLLAPGAVPAPRPGFGAPPRPNRFLELPGAMLVAGASDPIDWVLIGLGKEWLMLYATEEQLAAIVEMLQDRPQVPGVDAHLRALATAPIDEVHAAYRAGWKGH